MAELWPILWPYVSEMEEERFLLLVLAFLRVEAFNGDFCRCDHSIPNLMVSINI